MKQEQNSKNERKLRQFIGYTTAVFVMALAFILAKAPDTALATVNYTINYETQMLDASLNSGRVYISTDKEKTWENLEDSGSLVDISSLLQTKESYIYLKTSNTTTSTKVTLMAEPVNDMIITVTGNGITYSTSSGTVIEYQKGKNGSWISIGVSGTLNTKAMEYKGATLNFRTKAIPTRRAGKIVSVKVSKKPTAPSVKFDGGKLSITGLKANMQYRTPTSGWLPVILADKANSVSIYAYNGTSSVTNATYTSAFAATTLEFRVPATDKKAASSSKVVVVPAQPIFPGTITLTNSTLTVNGTTGTAYEYTVLEPNTTLDLNKARWTSITVNKSTILKGVSVNQVLFVRAKSHTDKTTKLTIPASTVVMQTITGITYVPKK